MHQTGPAAARLDRDIDAAARRDFVRGAWTTTIDVATPAGITAYAPGYIDRDNEIIVGLPATTAREAVQWLYFACLAAAKE